MRVRLVTIASCLVLVVVSLVAAGCGATLDPVAQAATRTSGVATLRFSMSMKLRAVAAGPSVPMTAHGAIDSAADRLELTLDASQAAALAGGPDEAGRMTIVKDGTVMYVTGSSVTGRLPGGKTWMRVDLSKAASALGLDLSSITGGQTDPRTSLAQLREAGNVVEVGHQAIRGVTATRYSVLLDLRAGLDKLDGASRSSMEELADRLEAAGARYVPADVWIDSNGYLRRFRMAMSNYLGTGTAFSLTMDLYDFGSAVHVAVPPAGQVADVTDLIS